MILYHGSNIEIDKIDLNKTRSGKDFGKGFYASSDYRQAVDFAHNVIKREGSGTPAVTSFQLDENILNQLSVKRFENYSKEWAEFVLANRKNKSDNSLHNYDIVIGPIADDNVGTQIRRLMQGFISFEVFLEEIKYSKITFQYYFGTENAIKHLKKL